ncbi:hypothetical protein EDB81DRAFT_846200 [Dactylonectria macrodidyma]|uniref:Rhodopsin domain-containing protein n=1 Tax=Dactylonectria macrodidyma TaxID=307937 RepID=A0A9P9IQ89_9HYPO|nr:hypothetical protein EDB81DRAFT_846200 [Dactylonectria macrodidyma]
MTVPNRGPQLAAVCWTLVTTAFLATSLRCYVRLRIVRNIGFDDWTMVGALISFIILVICTLLGVHYGTGRHYWDLGDNGIEQAMKYWWLCYLWYCITTMACKISIGSFLLRISVRRVDIWIIYSVMLVTVLTGVVFFFVTLFQCRPVSYFWEKDQHGSCLDVEVIIALTYMYSAFTVVCDFTFALLPLVLIWKLNMDRKSKIALIPIMTMACVASTAVVIRFAYVKDFRNPDFLYATVDIAIWSTTETGLAITAGSIATLRPLIRLIGHKLGLSTTGPSVLEDSDRPTGPGSRGAPQNTGGRNKHREIFSLTTFMRRDDQEEDTMGCEAGSNSDRDKSITGKRAHMWTKQQRDESNESEEELTMRD